MNLTKVFPSSHQRITLLSIALAISISLYTYTDELRGIFIYSVYHGVKRFIEGIRIYTHVSVSEVFHL